MPKFLQNIEYEAEGSTFGVFGRIPITSFGYSPSQYSMVMSISADIYGKGSYFVCFSAVGDTAATSDGKTVALVCYGILSSFGTSVMTGATLTNTMNISYVNSGMTSSYAITRTNETGTVSINMSSGGFLVSLPNTCMYSHLDENLQFQHFTEDQVTFDGYIIPLIH